MLKQAIPRTLEQLAVRRAMTELDAPAAAQPCHAS